MLTARDYLAVMKVKTAELNAIKVLDGDVSGIVPLWEDVPPKQAAVHKLLPDRLPDTWPAQQPYMLDVAHLDQVGFAGLDIHPLLASAAAAQALGHTMLPVCGPFRSSEHRSVCAQAVGILGNGLALRITGADCENAEELSSACKSLLLMCGCDRVSVDLILDLGACYGQSLGAVLQNARWMLTAAGGASNWRSIALVGASMPDGLGPLTIGWHTLPRVEWRAWKQFHAGPEMDRRELVYGDYNINSPALFSGSRATILAQLRYTTDDSFMVYRGHPTTGPNGQGYDQFYEICAELVQKDEWRGEDYSWGDAVISMKSTGAGGCGNAQTWRQIGTSHHLQTVREQLANHHAL